MKIGIICSTTETVSNIKEKMEFLKSEYIGMRKYVIGNIQNHTIITVFSRLGKVASSSTATTMIERYNVDCIISIGIAKSFDNKLNIGDIVIADSLVQHDMDTSISPGMQKFEIPLLGINKFDISKKLIKISHSSTKEYLEEDLNYDIPSTTLDEFKITKPKISTGLIASGDKLIASDYKEHKLKYELPNLKCIEMEGAAIAQITYEHGIDFILIRIIADKSTTENLTNPKKFVEKISTPIICGIIIKILKKLSDFPGFDFRKKPKKVSF